MKENVAVVEDVFTNALVPLICTKLSSAPTQKLKNDFVFFKKFIVIK